MDTANNGFQMMWDANGLYVLYQVDQTTWLPPLGGGNPLMSFSDDNLNLFFDPNTDNEENFDTTPDLRGWISSRIQPVRGHVRLHECGPPGRGL